MAHISFFSTVVLIFVTQNVIAQKTTRVTVSSSRGINITQMITDADTVFYMMGQNGKYTHITDIVSIKSGSASDINDLLTECMKFLPEADGTSLEYKGNTIMAMGNKRLMLFGSGRDQLDYVLLTPAVVTKLQSDLRPHVK